MSTTDELLEEMLEDAEEYATPVTDDDLQFWINEHLRVISIPKNGVVAGVEGDKNVNKIKFGMNRYYHGFDMSTFSGRILYSNAKGNKNYYNITDMQASGSAITFSWLVDADAVQYMGKTAFVVYLFKIQGSELRQKFYSTLATLKVLEGMEVDSAVPVEKQTDIIERMKEEISAYAEEVKKSLPADYTAMTEQVSSLKEDLKNLNIGIDDDGITPQKISSEVSSLPDGNLLTPDVLDISNLTNVGNAITRAIFKIPYSDENSGKNIRINAKYVYWRYNSIDVTEHKVEEENGNGYVDITLANSSMYKSTWIIFDCSQDVTRTYALYVEDWIEVYCNRKKLEWLDTGLPCAKFENVCGAEIVKNALLNAGYGTITKNNYTTNAVTQYIEAKAGDAFYTYFNPMAKGGTYNNLVLAMYDASKKFIGQLMSILGNSSVAAGWYKLVVPYSDCNYVRITTYAEKAIVFKCNSDYDFDGNENKISSMKGFEFDASIIAQNQINEAPLKRFEGKSMIVAGDSITEENDTNGNFPWCNYVAQYFGMNLTNAGKSGSGLYKLGDSGRGLYYRLLNREGEWAKGTYYDYIILHGFMNDGTGKNSNQGYISYNGVTTWDALPVGSQDDVAGDCSVYGMLRACFNMLVEYYPLSSIGFVCSTPRGQTITAVRDDPEGTNSSVCHGHGWFERYIKAYKYVCEEYNVPFLDLYHNSILRVDNEINYKQYFDNWENEISSFGGVVHPNALAHEKAIANPIFQWMKTYL